jgi:FkbM family methyltransferase
MNENLQLITCQGNKMYVDPTDQVIAQQLIRDGVHEEYETQVFRNLISTGNVVIVGANIGYYTLIAARILNGTGWVYAFEPEPHNFQILSKNIQVNQFTNITASQLALSNRNGRATLYTDRVNFGRPSLAATNVFERSGEVQIDTITLDSFFKKTASSKVDLLKIDAQGAEELIFQGARETLKRYAPKIVVEFWPFGLRNMGTEPDNLLALVEETGYKAKVIDKNRKRVQETNVMELIQEYASQNDGRGFVDLILEHE